MTLEAIWREYLRCCNERRFDDLDRFVHGELLFNGRPTTLADYAAAIRANTDAVPDFRWTVEDLLTTGDAVAVRLTDTGTPRAAWLGMEATGRSFCVQEMAFYRFRDGKFAEMWFLLDVSTLHEQLAGWT